MNQSAEFHEREKEELRQQIAEMKVEMEQQKEIYVKHKLLWEQERNLFLKEVDNLKFLLDNARAASSNKMHDFTIDQGQVLPKTHGSTTALREELLTQLKAVEKAIEIKKREQKIRQDLEVESKNSTELANQEQSEQEIEEPMVVQCTTMEVEKTAETLQNKLNISEQSEKVSISEAAEPQLETKTPTRDRQRKQLQKQFMSWLENHDCEDTNCTVVEFRNYMRHATYECYLTSGCCTWYICQRIHFKTEHLKTCNDRVQCKFCQPYVYFNETKLTGLMALLENGCPLNSESSKLNKDASMNMASRLVISYGLVGDNEKMDNSESSLSSTDSESSICSSSPYSTSKTSSISGEKTTSEEWEIVESDVPTTKVNWMERLKRSIHLPGPTFK